MADEENRDGSASAVMIPLTQLSLSGLVAKKRKRAQAENEDSEITEAQPVKRRFAPLKKPRKRVVDPTLRQVLGGNTSTPTISSAYLARPVSQSPRYDLQKLQHTSTLIDKCITERTPLRFAELRTHLHQIEVLNKYYVKDLVETSRILDVNSLRRIFSNHGVFPWDIAADADTLYKRLLKGNYDASLMKGIEVSKKKTVAYKLEKVYENQKVDTHHFGSNGLTNGDWWLFRICALRDGAHGAAEAGIHGKLGHGAYSIVLAMGGYDDEDNGETIKYCGTPSNTSKITAATSFLRESLLNQNPIRVLRAASKKSVYAPIDGIRYDGLYAVKAEKVLELETGMYRFSLERLPGQDPIRWQGSEKRPTQEQLGERDFVRHLIANATWA